MSPGHTYFGPQSPRNFAGFFNLKRYALLNLFKKSTALTLVLTLSWWQFAWAIDVRKLLWEQEQAFETNEMRRGEGITSEQLQASQSVVENEIQHQNDLEDLQNQNFSLTTPNGDVLEYIGNRLVEVQRPDGTTLTNIQVDADGNVIVADLLLSDGSLQVFQNGQIIAYRTADGTQVLYENGQVKKIIFADGSEAPVSYTSDNKPSLLLENGAVLVLEGTSFAYLLDPSGNKHFYENEKLSKIVLSTGWALDEIVLTADGLSILDFTVLDAEGSVVSQSGAITHPTLVPGTITSFGSFRDKAEFDYSTLQLSPGSIVPIRDGAGNLTALKIGDITIHYKTGASEIDHIEKSDGTELHDLVFDANGVIQDTLVISPDGEERLYRDGQLVSVAKPDLTKIFFADGKPQTLITPENLTYHFSYDTPGAIVANLDTSVALPGDTTAVKMVYDENFSLVQIIRQNEETLNYLNDDLVRIEFPAADPQLFEYIKDETGEMVSFSITQGDVETFYDANFEAFKAIIHPTVEDPDTLEVTYQFEKIREVYKNGVLTFIYSYALDTDGEELTLIDDLEEKVIKTYKNGFLLTSFSPSTSVLSTYSYTDGKVSKVEVTRLGRLLHVYHYAYDGGLTIVTDEGGVIRTYDAGKQLILREEEGVFYSYTYHEVDGKEIIEEELVKRVLKDGAVVLYEKGQVDTIELPNGSVITDIVLDGGRNILRATMTLVSGDKFIFNQNSILEEIHTDGTHFYFSGNKLSKVETPDGLELLYSYDQNVIGNTTAIWVEVNGTKLKYDTASNLLLAKFEGFLTPEEIEASAQHVYQGGSGGPYSHDGDLNSAQLGGGGGGAGSYRATLRSEHTFGSPSVVLGFSYRMGASSSSSGETDNGSDAATYIETKDATTGKWTVVSGTKLSQNHSNSGGGGSTAYANTANPATVNVTISNVIAVRATSSAGAFANESGSHNAFAMIYDVQYSLADVSYFNFKKVTNPAGQLLRYTFQGYPGTINYDLQGDLLAGTPQSLTAQAQTLNGLVDSLVNTPYFLEINAQVPAALGDWFSIADEAVLDGETVVAQEFSQDGVLETQTKADQTVTLYENSKPVTVLSESGIVLIQYGYDANGDPVRVYLKNARETLPNEILEAHQRVEEEKAKALHDLAVELNHATDTIEGQVWTRRELLKIQLNILQNQFNSISDMEVKGKEAKSQKGDILNQIGGTMDETRGNLSDLAKDESEAYASLDAQIQDLSDQIDAEVEVAFAALAAQEAELKTQILLQEISPIVFDTYRKIMGRDPSSAEYDFWVEQIDYASGDTFAEVKTTGGENLSEALKNYLYASPELLERQTYVQNVKDRVTQKINEYLAAADEDKAAFLSNLGLAQDEAIALSASDAQKVLAWLNSSSLHFGQSAFLSLEELFDQKGIHYAREDIAEKAILIDILAGVLTPLDDSDLVLSIYALNKTAKLYGLDLVGANLTFEDLLVIASGEAAKQSPLRIIAHITNNHFVVITAIDGDRVTYIASHAGPDKENEIVTTSREAFEKSWKGNVSLETEKVQTLPGYQEKLLSAQDTQRLRGAGWSDWGSFFLNFAVAFLSIAFPLLAPFLQAALRIYNIVEGIMSGNWLSVGLNIIGFAFDGFNIGGIFEGVGNFFGNIFKPVLGVFDAVKGAIGQIGNFIGNFNIPGLTSQLATELATQAFSMGLNFGIQMGLSSLGLDPALTQVLSVFAKGALFAAFNPQTFSFGNFIKELTALPDLQTASLGLLTHLGLDPHLATVLSFVMTPFANGLSFAFGGGSPGISPAIQDGLDPLGFDLGANSFFGTPFSVFGSQLAQNLGQNLIPNLLQDIGQGFLEGAINAGFQYLGDSNPWLNYILDENLAAGLTQAISRDGIFTVASRIINGTLGAVSDLAGAIVQAIPDFGSLIQSEGPLGIVNLFLDSLFGRSTLEALISQDQIQSGDIGTPSGGSAEYGFDIPLDPSQPIPQPMPTPPIGFSSDLWNALIQLGPMIINLFGEGIANAGEIGFSPVTGAPTAITRSFIFGNGFNNEIVPESTPDNLVPPFMTKLREEGIIKTAGEFLVSMYETTNLFGNAVDWATDFLLNLEDQSLWDSILQGQSSVFLPEPLRSWANEGIRNHLIQEVKAKLLQLEQDKGQRTYQGIAFSHSGFFAPLMGVLEQTRPDGSYFDVHTVINYEGPFGGSRSEFIDNPNLKTIINVWGTGTLVEGDYGPPKWMFENADFQGPSPITNVNIEIQGAWHNDFSYNPNDYADRTDWNEDKAKRERINQRTSLFMRRLYEKALDDQAVPGKLDSFLKRTVGITFDETRQVWQVDTELLNL